MAHSQSSHSMTSLSEYFKSKQEEVNKALELLVSENKKDTLSLIDAVRYSLLSPGKRLRPILCLASIETLNGDLDAGIAPACALEMIHTYSMIHDDLPCMDDDDFRRGKPTLHKVYSESYAVLAGDLLQTLAYETLAHAPLLTSDQKIALVSVLAQSAGIKGMVGGQIMDLEAENRNVDLKHLQSLHAKKTGALIAASIEFGGIISDALPQHREILRKFGQDIGLAFQIIDDVLDVTSTQEQLGKPVGSDEANLKSTYVSLLGVQEAKQKAASLIAQAQKNLHALPFDASLLSQIAEFMTSRAS